MYKHTITEVFSSENFIITDRQAELLFHFYELLAEWNKVMNLTAITDFYQVVYRHFLDSVYGGREMAICQGVTVIDVGTGAGFPGIPLKICYPELKVTLMDSLRKRVDFLNMAVSELGLTDIWAVHSRAEDMGRDVLYREQFDYAVSRAVADLSVLSEYCLPFVKKGGSFLSYKGGNIKEELKRSKKAIEILGGRLSDVKEFSYTAGEPYQRTIAVIQKVRETGKKYPRKAGIPGKTPLGK